MTCLNDLVMVSPRLWHKYHLHGLWRVGLGWDISSQDCPWQNIEDLKAGSRCQDYRGPMHTFETAHNLCWHLQLVDEVGNGYAGEEYVSEGDQICQMTLVDKLSLHLPSVIIHPLKKDQQTHCWLQGYKMDSLSCIEFCCVNFAAEWWLRIDKVMVDISMRWYKDNCCR